MSGNRTTQADGSLFPFRVWQRQADGVSLSLYPPGDKGAVVSLSLEQARVLRDALDAAVSEPTDGSLCDSSPQILDACCGGRHWWWDKAHPLALYMDERVVPLGNEWRATWECKPDVVGDFRSMPFADESFQLVLFDPPHIVRKNLETKWSTRFYGALHPERWQSDLRAGFAECWRVLRAGGSLVFKWSGDTSRCSPYFPAEPIVGTRGGADTSWFVFYKPLASVTVAVAA